MQTIEGTDEYIANVLCSLFEGHGVKAELQDNRVIFPDFPDYWVNGDCYIVEGTVQMDVRMGGFDGDRVIVESNCGFGDSIEEQVNFAMQSTANASFHVFLPAFIEVPACHGTEKEIWKIVEDRDVFAGLITTVFGYPPAGEDGIPDMSFYEKFIEKMETFPLAKGTHWIRIQHMRMKDEALCNDVLLDNEPWPEMQEFIASHDWPHSEEPYDVRVFLIIKDRV